MSLKCEFYLNLNVVTSKIMPYEQNKAASPVHQFPVAIETLSIPMHKLTSLVVSVCSCPNTLQVTLTPQAQKWLNLPSITIYPFSISDVGTSTGPSWRAEAHTEAFLHHPPQSTWQYCPWHVSDLSHTRWPRWLLHCLWWLPDCFPRPSFTNSSHSVLWMLRSSFLKHKSDCTNLFCKPLYCFLIICWRIFIPRRGACITLIIWLPPNVSAPLAPSHHVWRAQNYTTLALPQEGHSFSSSRDLQSAISVYLFFPSPCSLSLLTVTSVNSATYYGQVSTTLAVTHSHHFLHHHLHWAAMNGMFREIFFPNVIWLKHKFLTTRPCNFYYSKLLLSKSK